tara:strand:- start:140 stop:535 length:396 start_codon:yes stop_codon:yes gene_type:complete
VSEWLDNQKERSGNFRQFLQERIEKTNPRRQLTSDETNRLSKLEAVADKLKRGKTCKTVSYKLGYMHKEGEGVLKDYMASHMWYNISSANGHPYAGEWRDKIGALMSPSSIEKATEMARECMASDYKKCGY